MSDDYNWYVLQTKPRNERRAERELSNQGYVSYLPEIQQRRFSKGRERTVNEALFPRYLFVRLSRVLSCWHPIRSTRGVTRLVAFGDGDPLPISDHIVDSVRDSCLKREVQPRFKLGDHVSIVPASTRERESPTIWGQLASLDGEGRVVVLLTLLGREHRIHVESDRLTAA